MSLYIVDSSVVIKWYSPEALSAEAIRVRDGSVPLCAPDFVTVEVASICWKKIRRGVMTRAIADTIQSNFDKYTVVARHSTVPLVAPAFDIADQTGRSVYDCLYLALAVQLGGTMVTADDKLVNALAGTAWAANIMKLQDVP